MKISNNIRLEFITLIICVLASIIGPMILINAHFSFMFVVSGLVFGVYCIFLSLIISKACSILFACLGNRQNPFIVGLVGGFLPFLTLGIYHNRDNLLSLLRISKVLAFFNFSVIMGISLFMMALIVLRGSSMASAVYKIGMGFLLPIVITMLMMPLIPSSEGQVLLGNVTVIYFTVKRTFNHFIKL